MLGVVYFAEGLVQFILVLALGGRKLADERSVELIRLAATWRRSPKPLCVIKGRFRCDMIDMKEATPAGSVKLSMLKKDWLKSVCANIWGKGSFLTVALIVSFFLSPSSSESYENSSVNSGNEVSRAYSSALTPITLSRDISKITSAGKLTLATTSRNRFTLSTTSRFIS